nr:hypothetical protein [Tanacetum cinerariifolium]
MNYQPVHAENQTNFGAGFQDNFDVEKAGEEVDQSYMLFPMWSTGFTNPQNNAEDAAFDGKEHDFDVKKPESQVILSPSSKFQDCSENSSNEVTTASSTVPTVGQNSLNSTNTFSTVGPSNTAVSLTYGKTSDIDASQLLDDLDMPGLEDIIYSDDEDVVGAEADFNNLESSIPVRCQFLGCRLIPWQCKKQTVVATSSTEAEYVAAISCCAQALTINPHIYVSCVKQFWNTVVVKQSNDITRLQALVDKKKVVITEATIREALHLDDAAGVDCLPNEEIFAELARMGYEKPSTKLTFYKAFFSSQWKFLIHTILQSLGAKRTSWNEFSSTMASTVIFLSTEEQVQDDSDDDAAQGVDTAVEGDDVHEPSIPSPTPPIPPPQQSLDLPSTSQHLERGNKVKVLKLRRLKKVGTSQRIESSDDNVMEDASNQGRMTDVLMVDKEDEKKTEEAMGVGDDQVKGRQAEIYKIDMDHASKVLSMQEDEPEVQEVVGIVTTAKLITKVVSAASETVHAASIIIVAAEPQVPAATIIAAPVRVAAAASTKKRKGVVIRDPEEESSTIRPAKTKSKDKGKGIMVKEPKPMKKKQQVEMDKEYARKLHEELNMDIDWDVAIDHVKEKAKEDPYVQRYQVMKKRSQTEAQARRNMIMYLKNVVGFRLDYFKEMSYDDIRPIFEAKFNLNIEYLLKSKEQIEEEENIAIQSINETPAQKAAKRRKLNEEVKDLKQHLEIVPDEDDDVYTEATPLARKVPVVDYELIHFNNKPYYKIIRADGTHQLYLILLVERRYPLSRFTLDQMLNAVRTRVEEQSEMSLELLRFIRQQHQEGQLE